MTGTVTAATVSGPTLIFRRLSLHGRLLWNGLYGCDLIFVRHNILDELSDLGNESSLIYNTAKDDIHEHGRLGDIIEARLQIGVRKSTLD